MAKRSWSPMSASRVSGKLVVSTARTSRTPGALHDGVHGQPVAPRDPPQVAGLLRGERDPQRLGRLGAVRLGGLAVIRQGGGRVEPLEHAPPVLLRRPPVLVAQPLQVVPER